MAQNVSSVTRAVTFLLTDIEGSTAAWEADPNAMAAALAVAARGADQREEANAWRLLGKIEARRGRVEEARRSLLKALDIDSKLEVPERIALDLIALARLELTSGNREAGYQYAKRAASVAQAANLGAVLAEARTLLAAKK